MGVQCFFSFFKGIKAARCRLGKTALFIIAVMVIKLAVGVLEDNNALLVELILRYLLHTLVLSCGRRQDFLFFGKGFRHREISNDGEPFSFQQVVHRHALIGKAVILQRAVNIAPRHIFRFLQRFIFPLFVHAVFDVVINHHLITAGLCLR